MEISMKMLLQVLTSVRRRKAIRLAILAGVALATPLSAFADGDQDDSQAISAETDAALIQAGQEENTALEQLMTARGLWPRLLRQGRHKSPSLAFPQILSSPSTSVGMDRPKPWLPRS